MTGIKTNAPEIRMVIISGPSIRDAEVRTMKQSAAQKSVRMTHCVLMSGCRIELQAF